MPEVKERITEEKDVKKYSFAIKLLSPESELFNNE